MRVLVYCAALMLASVTFAVADDMPAPPPPAPADTATSTSTTTTTTSTVTTTGDPMAATYGNTIVVKGGGPESHTHYNADHTFNGVAPEYNYPYQGTWELTADGKICRTFNPEVPTVTNPDCDPAPPGTHAVGDTWTDEKGRSISLIAGIQ